jgi:hypothetical protein
VKPVTAAGKHQLCAVNGLKTDGALHDGFCLELKKESNFCAIAP